MGRNGNIARAPDGWLTTMSRKPRWMCRAAPGSPPPPGSAVWQPTPALVANHNCPFESNATPSTSPTAQARPPPSRTSTGCHVVPLNASSPSLEATCSAPPGERATCRITKRSGQGSETLSPPSRTARQRRGLATQFVAPARRIWRTSRQGMVASDRNHQTLRPGERNTVTALTHREAKTGTRHPIRSSGPQDLANFAPGNGRFQRLSLLAGEHELAVVLRPQACVQIPAPTPKLIPLPGSKCPVGAARRGFDQLHRPRWGAITFGEVLRDLLLKLLRRRREVCSQAGAKRQAEGCAATQT